MGDTAEGTSPVSLTVLPLSPQHYLNADIVTFTEVSKDPKGMEWLWNPQIVGIYNRLLQRCELNKHTTEAASGALQNITAGDRRVRAREGNVRWSLPCLACLSPPPGQSQLCPGRGCTSLRVGTSLSWVGDVTITLLTTPAWVTRPGPVEQEEEEEDGVGGGGSRWVPGRCLQAGVCLGSGRAC